MKSKESNSRAESSYRIQSCYPLRTIKLTVQFFHAAVKPLPRPIAIATFALSLGIFPRICRAQVTNATLTGTVADSTGAAIPGTRVQVKTLGTNALRATVTNGAGIYTVGHLIPGRYSITASKSGFQTKSVTGVVLTVGQAATLNLTLAVGRVKQTVTVSGSAALINTSNNEISQVIGQHAIKQLPLNGRNPASLVLLSPGTTNVLNTGAGTLQTETTFPTETGASAGGGRQGSTYYLLDGAPNMDTYLLLAAPFPDSDATQEFRVISNSFSVQYGYSPSAIVSIQTKSGTNQFHGGVFEFVRNDALNAANSLLSKLACNELAA